MPILICNRVIFYSAGDERIFFEFARNIKGVRRLAGTGDTLELHVASRLSNAALRDLLGLFQRYKIPMRQLRQFQTAQNRNWFRDEKQFWFKKVFGN